MELTGALLIKGVIAKIFVNRKDRIWDAGRTTTNIQEALSQLKGINEMI